ncbi:hypothetical protein ACOMHN_034957 [Nucella lapillus]
MLKTVCIALLATFALAKLGNIFIDSVHGFRVKYDDRHSITHTEAQQYHSRLEEFQCRTKSVFKVDYTPSSN